MGTRKKTFVILAIAGFLLLDLKLIKDIANSKNEYKSLPEKVNFLSKKEHEATENFILKQDHMRKMLNDKNFSKQVIRKKEGYIERNETVFKFEN